MAKSLFKKYDYEFDKNEAKIITTFCKQASRQMMSDERFAADVRAFQSIVDKINNDPLNVKLTKDEKVRFVRQLKENIKYINQQMSNSWFIKRWLMRSMYNQYNSLLSTHFSN